jgi:creatinine amidohydrolase
MACITVRAGLMAVALAALAAPAVAQPPANPLWQPHKTKNYLPEMTWPEVADFLTRSDMVIIPVTAIEEHGRQGPLGTDFFNGVEQAKLIAQRTEVLVAPILLPGNSPYHMGFPGTITLKPETIQEVYFEAAQSLIEHGFRRFLFLNAHGGNAATTRFIVDRVNQETAGIAVELGEAASPFLKQRALPGATPGAFDRHAGFEETSESLYLTPGLLDMSQAKAAPLTLPPHLAAMIPAVTAGDRTAQLVFLAEALKAKETGKHTSTREMTASGNWTEADLSRANADAGRIEVESFTDAAVQFIDTWRKLRPLHPAEK